MIQLKPAVLTLVLFGSLTCASAKAIVSKSSVTETFGDGNWSFTISDATSGKTQVLGKELADRPLPPCSTFKIWNTLIGFETGVLVSPDQPFWKWDGEKRFFDDWNKDQTLRHAFAVSCVPAYQQLARDIGEERMKSWIDRLDYGNRDISSGLDQFWLPREGTAPILISPNMQRVMLEKLLNGKLPVSSESIAKLTEIMLFSESEKGKLYGKTGMGTDYTDPEKPSICWFVGFVQHNGVKYPFSAVKIGKEATSKGTRDAVKAVFERNGML